MQRTDNTTNTEKLMNGNYVTYGYYQGAMVVTAIHLGGEKWRFLYRMGTNGKLVPVRS